MSEDRKQKREQARQARLEAQRKRKQAERRRKLIIWGLIVLILAGSLGFYLYRNANRRSAAEKARLAAGCTEIIRHEELEAAPHLQNAEEPHEYNSWPPSSGRHLGNTAPWGVLPDTVEPELYVHNLEHGGVVIVYNPDEFTDSEIEDIEDLVEGYPASQAPGGGSGVILNPDPDAEKPLGMSAWQYTQTCEELNTTVLSFFISQRCGKGPESFPLGCA